MDRATQEHDAPACSICGRELGSDGLPPSPDGDGWICGDCEAARSFGTLDLSFGRLRRPGKRPGVLPRMAFLSK